MDKQAKKLTKPLRKVEGSEIIYTQVSLIVRKRCPYYRTHLSCISTQPPSPSPPVHPVEHKGYSSKSQTGVSDLPEMYSQWPLIRLRATCAAGSFRIRKIKYQRGNLRRNPKSKRLSSPKGAV